MKINRDCVCTLFPLYLLCTDWVDKSAHAHGNRIWISCTCRSTKSQMWISVEKNYKIHQDDLLYWDNLLKLVNLLTSALFFHSLHTDRCTGYHLSRSSLSGVTRNSGSPRQNIKVAPDPVGLSPHGTYTYKSVMWMWYGVWCIPSGPRGPGEPGF